MTLFKWYNQIKDMAKAPLYNEDKATQVAAYLLELNGGSMEYYKCIKLIYSIERESIRRWLRPVTYDNLCSMQHGQVVSQTLDRSKYRLRPAKSTWSGYLKTIKDEAIKDEIKDKTLVLIKKCSTDRLSNKEIDLIREIYQTNRKKSVDDIINEHHNPNKFPEWKRTEKTSIPTEYSELLRIFNKTQEQLDEFNADLSELTILGKLA